jgi:hypothetical protein
MSLGNFFNEETKPEKNEQNDNNSIRTGVKFLCRNI